MLVRSVFPFLAAIVALPVAGDAQSLLESIQSGDPAKVHQALNQEGVDVNSRDAQGTTALMYAALYGAADTMKLLIERGADVNAANQAGATALMTAIADLDKVRLLVERGARVDAKSAAGNTPLGLASRLPGADPVVRYLVGKGVIPSAASLRSAMRHSDLDLTHALMKAGAKLDAAPATLFAASMLGDAGVLRSALETSPETKPDPNPAARSTPLMAAAFYGSAEIVRLLTAKGEAVDAADNRGRTALMYAVARPHPDPAVIQALIDAGASRTIKDTRGDTPADWARSRADKAALRAVGADPAAHGADGENSASLPPLREALQRALGLLDEAGPKFFKANGCISCHNQSIPQMAFDKLRQAGLPVSAGAAQTHTKAVLATWNSETANMWQSSCAAGGGQVATLTYGLTGLAAAGQPRTPAIDAAAHCLMALQEAQGSWNLPDFRAPLGIGREKFTALAIRGLRQYPLPGRTKELGDRVARARRYLETVAHDDTQGLVFRILGLRWAGSEDAKLIARLTEELEKLQRPGGGWAQRAGLAPDAYATGQALWALVEGGGRAAASDPAYQRGAEYLRRTQKSDGSWHVRTRGFGFQPYRETGFPHGHDQWLSAAATGFAILGLAPGAAAAK